MEENQKNTEKKILLLTEEVSNADARARLAEEKAERVIRSMQEANEAKQSTLFIPKAKETDGLLGGASALDIHDEKDEYKGSRYKTGQKVS